MCESAPREQKPTIGIVKSGKKKKLPLEGAGDRNLMKRFWKNFYRLHYGKFQIRFTRPLVNREGYKSRRIEQRRVLCFLRNFYFLNLSLPSLGFETLCAYCVVFISKDLAPSNSSNLEFFFHARMTATNPAESSAPVTSTEQETEEVVEIESEAEEVISTLSPVTKKGKEKAQGSRKPVKWAGVTPHTSPRNVKSLRATPLARAAAREEA